MAGEGGVAQPLPLLYREQNNKQYALGGDAAIAFSGALFPAAYP
jgi:hypothetical protein